MKKIKSHCISTVDSRVSSPICRLSSSMLVVVVMIWGSVGHIEMVVTCQSGGGSKVEVVDVVQEVGVYMAFFYITRTYIK